MPFPSSDPAGMRHRAKNTRCANGDGQSQHATYLQIIPLLPSMGKPEMLVFYSQRQCRHEESPGGMLGCAIPPVRAKPRCFKNNVPGSRTVAPDKNVARHLHRDRSKPAKRHSLALQATTSSSAQSMNPCIPIHIFCRKTFEPIPRIVPRCESDSKLKDCPARSPSAAAANERCPLQCQPHS